MPIGRERAPRLPGMPTVVSIGITAAYVYSAATTFGVEDEGFYWELATLVDVMLLGHWIEMRAVGAPWALLFTGPRVAAGWFIVFVGTVVLAGSLEPVVDAAARPGSTIVTIFSVLNVSA